MSFPDYTQDRRLLDRQGYKHGQLKNTGVGVFFREGYPKHLLKFAGTRFSFGYKGRVARIAVLENSKPVTLVEIQKSKGTIEQESGEGEPQ